MALTRLTNKRARWGATQFFVSRYETGEQRLDLLETKHVPKALGVTLEEFDRRLEARLGKRE